MLPDASVVNSAIYRGTVYHRRFGERAHTLRYGLFYFMLDPAEADALDRCSRWFGYNRAAWLSFQERDHGDGGDLRHWLRSVLDAAAISNAETLNFRILCLPRVAGYVFNPISVIYCLDEHDAVRAMVYEVNNTFGERLSYVMPVASDAAPLRHRCDKALFVSPFFPLDGHYEFALSRPGPHLDLGIDYHAGDVRRLRASFQGERAPFDQRTLRSVALGYPLATLKVIWGIHFEALRLWLKGVPLVRHVSLSGQTIAIGKEQ